MAVSLRIWKSLYWRGALTSPHQIYFSLTASVTILLSLGDLPDLTPENATNAPESAMQDFLVSGSAGLLIQPI